VNRPSSTTIRWCVLGVVVAVVAALAAFVPTSADAQSTGNPTAEIVVVEPAAGQSFRTVAVDLASGDVGLAAITAELSYDPAAITVLGCEISEAGACNDLGDGRILVSVFNTNGLLDNNQLVTANFQTAAATSGTSTFDLTIVEAVDITARDLELFQVEANEFDLEAPTFGSITGDVVAADSQTGLYAIEVCAVNSATDARSCVNSTGLGTWRIDDLPAGTYDIKISDPAQVYGSATLVATVAGEAVTAGLVSELGAFTEADAADQAEDAVTQDDAQANDTSTDEPAVTIAPAPVPPAVTIVYEASITGRVTAIDGAQPVEGVQICATQPLVLNQSCGTSDALGNYALNDLSAGNYWVTVTDPFNRFQNSAPELVGVNDDTSVRDRVNIQLSRFGG